MIQLNCRHALVGLLLVTVAACGSPADDVASETTVTTHASAPATTEAPATTDATPPEPAATSKSVDWIDGYQLGHLSCGYDPEQLYAESGTRDKRRAAAWAADTFTGDVEKGYAAGCVDALNGKSSKHP